MNNNTTIHYESGIIAKGGMGSFLCPPTHPAHSYHVEIDLKRKKENRGSMSLEYAVDCEYLSPSCKKRVITLLNKWQKPDINSQNIKEWIYEVLGYFKNCYQSAQGSWNASDLSINSKINPIENQDLHAGVHLIRRYYPDFVATADDFFNASWGNK